MIIYISFLEAQSHRRRCRRYPRRHFHPLSTILLRKRENGGDASCLSATKMATTTTKQQSPRFTYNFNSSFLGGVLPPPSIWRRILFLNQFYVLGSRQKLLNPSVEHKFLLGFFSASSALMPFSINYRFTRVKNINHLS